MLLIVMSYHNKKEFEVFQRILDNWDQLIETNTPLSFLFVQSIPEKLQTNMPHTFLEYRDEFPEDDFQKRVSTEFRDVAKHVEDNINCNFWFWWETDVLPVKKDCFDFFLSKAKPTTKIMGYKVKDRLYEMYNKINGVAFYSKCFASYAANTSNLNKNFDKWVSYGGRRNSNDYIALNKWYSLVHHEKALFLDSELRVVHGIKDSRLLDHVLLGKISFKTIPTFQKKIFKIFMIIIINIIEFIEPHKFDKIVLRLKNKG